MTDSEFEKRWSPCRKMVRDYAYKCGVEADDFEQDVKLKAWQGLPTFTDAHPFAAWVNRIARNLCIDALRKFSRRVQPLSFADGSHEYLGSEAETEFIENRVVAEAFLADLRRTCKESDIDLLLSHLFGFTFSEIATRRGGSARNLKLRYHRLRARMAA